MLTAARRSAAWIRDHLPLFAVVDDRGELHRERLKQFGELAVFCRALEGTPVSTDVEAVRAFIRSQCEDPILVECAGTPLGVTAMCLAISASGCSTDSGLGRALQRALNMDLLEVEERPAFRTTVDVAAVRWAGLQLHGTRPEFDNERWMDRYRLTSAVADFAAYALTHQILFRSEYGRESVTFGPADRSVLVALAARYSVELNTDLLAELLHCALIAGVPGLGREVLDGCWTVLLEQQGPEGNFHGKVIEPATFEETYHLTIVSGLACAGALASIAAPGREAATAWRNDWAVIRQHVAALEADVSLWLAQNDAYTPSGELWTVEELRSLGYRVLNRRRTQRGSSMPQANDSCILSADSIRAGGATFLETARAVAARLDGVFIDVDMADGMIAGAWYALGRSEVVTACFVVRPVVRAGRLSEQVAHGMLRAIVGQELGPGYFDVGPPRATRVWSDQNRQDCLNRQIISTGVVLATMHELLNVGDEHLAAF